MGQEWTTTGSVEFEPGAYEGHLLKIEKRQKVFVETDDDGNEVREDRSFLIWHFAVDEEGYENAVLTAVSSNSWGPKSKARQWAGYILRNKLDDGVTVREDDLKGKPVVLNIDLEDTPRGTFAKITSLAQVRSSREGRASSNKKAEAAEVEKHLDEQEKAS
jgi:hypothetical protein